MLHDDLVKMTYRSSWLILLMANVGHRHTTSKTHIIESVNFLAYFYHPILLTCLFLLQSRIAKRSDMVVMSTDGVLGAYVNPHGFVHETITVSNATGLALIGNQSTVHSWFPGYDLVSVVCCSF